MPNWCSNSCRMTAPMDHPLMVKIIAELELGQNARWFQAVVPVPQALLDAPARAGSPVTEDEEKLEASFGYKNWYDFCIAEWKTKWEAKVDRHEIEGDSVLVYFDTAWSPPDGIFEAMHKAGISVEAAYCEQGVGYMGWWKDGEECVVDMPELNPDDEDDMQSFYEAIDKFFEDAGIDAPEGLGG